MLILTNAGVVEEKDEGEGDERILILFGVSTFGGKEARERG